MAAVLRAARRVDPETKAAAIVAALRGEQLAQPAQVSAAYAAGVRALVEILSALNSQIQTLEAQIEAHFGEHPDAEVYLSQPGLGVLLAARCWPSSATTRTATRTPGPGATRPAPARSPTGPGGRPR